MSPIAIIALVNALMDLGMKIMREYRAPVGTPEEELAELEALKIELADTAAKVAAYRPLEGM